LRLFSLSWGGLHLFSLFKFLFQVLSNLFLLLNFMGSLVKLGSQASHLCHVFLVFDLESRYLFSLGKGNSELILKLLVDHDSFVFFSAESEHMNHLLLLLLLQLLVLLLQCDHVLQIIFNLTGHLHPGTFALVVHGVEVVEVELGGAVLRVHNLSKLFELKVIV